MAWIAALALVSNVDGHCLNLIESLSNSINDLAGKLVDCRTAKEKSKLIFKFRGTLET